MKNKFKRALSLAVAVTMVTASNLGAFAATLPTITLNKSSVSVNHDDSSTVKIKIENWESSTYPEVKVDTGDSDICKVSVTDSDDDSAKIKVKAKGTGSTYVKVWLDGYERAAQYFSVNSIYYNKEDVNGYSVRHYGYMTGKNGEVAKINKFKVKDDDRLVVYFDFISGGSGDGTSAVFTANCEEDDGDATTVTATATGMTVGGEGYKVSFKIPDDDITIIKLVDNEV